MYPPPGCGIGLGGGIRCMPDMLEVVEDMVFVRPSDIIEGGDMEEFMVCDRPGGGAAPKMLEKAASRWKLLDDPYWFPRGGGIRSCW